MKKYGKFYASWYDATGRRKRKSFDTKKSAVQYQTKQRHIERAKVARKNRSASARSTR